MDLGFAISARGFQSQANFQKMKDVIKEVVEKYGQERIHYSVIVFGSKPDVKIEFSSEFSSDRQLKNNIDTFSIVQGSSLAPTLQKAKELFDKGARPGVKKVLVVIMDTTSDGDKNELQENAQLLEKAKIKVVPVGLGDEVDHKDLEVLSPHKTNTITAKSTIPTDDLTEEIMRIVFEGKTLKSTLAKG